MIDPFKYLRSLARGPGLANAAAQAAAMAFSLLTVPVLLSYLGPKYFGLWATLTAICAFNSLFDLGTGFSAQNRITRARTLNEPVGRVASQAFTISLIVSMLAGLIFAGFTLADRSPFIPELDQDIRWCAVVNIFVGFIASAPLQILKFAHASKRGHLQGIYALASGALLLGFSMAAARLGITRTWFIAVSPLAQLVPLAAIWAYISRVDSSLRVSLSWDRREVFSLLRQGFHFLPPQLVGFFLTAGPVMASASILGLESTALTHVYSRMVNAFGQLRAQLLYPIWPRVAGAIAAKDRQEVAAIASRTIMATFIVTMAAGLVVALAGPVVIRLWVPSVAQQSTSMHFAAVIVYLVGISLLQATNYIMNGMDLLVQQTVGGLITIASISVVLILAGPAFGQSALWASFGIPLCVFYVPWCGWVLLLALKDPAKYL